MEIVSKSVFSQTHLRERNSFESFPVTSKILHGILCQKFV